MMHHSNKPRASYTPFSNLEDSPQPILNHLIELRRRLLYIAGFFLVAFIVSYGISEHIFTLLVRPLAHLFEGESSRRLIYTGLQEAFITYLKVAFFTAAFITFPLALIQIWRFIVPGLYEQEKKSFFPFFLATPLLFLLGAGFAYFMIIPAAWQFFLKFEVLGGSGTLPIQLEARVHEYLSLVMQLLWAFGLSFQLPVALVLLVRGRVISELALRKNRKYAFIIIMIASAFLTPPDVLSMLGLALPLYFLYEGSIVLVRVLRHTASVQNKN